jgi:biotin operon repressor
MTAFTAPTPRPAARAVHQIDAERARFYELLWGEQPGYVFVAAGLPAADVRARGWPLAAGEQPGDPAQLADKMLLLLWTRADGDAFKAAGRPHTGKVFAWPQEARDLDRYVARLSAEYDNVYVRPYLADTPDGAKRGDAPAAARIVRVEDAPADPGALAPPYSFVLQTSAYSRQAFYILPDALPWHQVQRIATGLAERLNADSGGSNAAQFTRVPTTRNTKEKAERYRVTLHEGAGPVALDRVARSALPGGLPELRSAVLVDSDGRERRASAEPADPALWADLPDGAALMRSPRYQALFAKRPQLAALAMGKRVALPTKHGMRDSGSEQVAVLISNLLTTGRPGPDGRFVPGLGAPPENEIRAVALYWRETLRPGCPGYCADVDRLIAEYRPVGYAPEATTNLQTDRPARAPRPLEAPKHTGRPAGQRNEQADRLFGMLAESVGRVVSTPDLARALGVTDRMVREYLSDLRSAGVLETTRTRYGLRITRAEIKSAPVSEPTPEAQPGQSGNRPAAEVQECGIRTVEIAHQAAMHGEHTAPQVPASPAADAAVTDLAAQVADWIACYGYRWRAIQAAARHEYGDEVDCDELRRAFDLHPWRAYRAELRSLDDAALLVRCRSSARAHQRAVRRCDPRVGWYATRLAMAEEERRRRRLDLVAPEPGSRRRKRATWSERNAAAAATVERLSDQAKRLPDGEPGTTRALAALDAQQTAPPAPAPASADTERPRLPGLMAHVEEERRSPRQRLIERLSQLGVAVPESLLTAEHRARLGIEVPSGAYRLEELLALGVTPPGPDALTLEQLADLAEAMAAWQAAGNP